jgi:trehalose 6-phosphate synthase
LGSQDAGYTLKAVPLTAEEIEQYYYGFANEIIWPLFHDMQSRCNFDPTYWDAYQAVSRKFAQVIASNIEDGDYLWIQDYHLMLVAKELRSLGVTGRIGFFLHTPFPSPDIFSKLPWRSQVLRALLDYDLIGFQTARDRNNFVRCTESLIRNVDCDTRRQVCLSMDFASYARQAAGSVVSERARQLRETMPGSQLILGVDRLDYSKGIPQKLRAFREALEHYPDLAGRVTLVQLTVPSREDIPEYKRLKNEVTSLVSEINGKLAQADWIPVNYLFRNLGLSELLAYYRSADIALITPLKDGMNLVAKEYCASQIDGNGVLILSEFAGTAAQLRRNAVLVNPYDIEGMAGAIYRAYNMSLEERQSRMRRMRNSVQRRDIFWWVDSFLRTASGLEAD